MSYPARRRLALLVMAFAAAPVTARAQGVSGTVVDGESKRPIAGVSILVSLTTDSLALRATITDTAGRFSIRLPRPGVYEIMARRIGLQPLASPRRQIDSGTVRTVRFEMFPVAVLLDTVRTDANKYLRGSLYKLTAGQEWFAQHYRAGKGFFTSGAEILLSRMNSCDYFARIPGFVISNLKPIRGESAIRCFDGQPYPTRYVMTEKRPSCFRAFVDRKLLLQALDSTDIGLEDPLSRDVRDPGLSEHIWISLADIQGIEVFANHADIPKDLSYPLPDDTRPCSLVLVWTRRYWGPPS